MATQDSHLRPEQRRILGRSAFEVSKPCSVSSSFFKTSAFATLSLHSKRDCFRDSRTFPEEATHFTAVGTLQFAS